MAKTTSINTILPVFDVTNYSTLVTKISDVYAQGRQRAVQAVNTNMLETYWEIGRHIVEYEQGGSAKAEYGKGLLPRLSNDLKEKNGKGFSLSNIIRMRQLYAVFPNYAELPHKLSWSHLVELLKIDDPLERSFYTQQSIIENWSSTQLIRQKKTSLFLRLAASKDKAGILTLAKEGHMAQNPSDLIREPYVLEFLKIPEPYHLSETELEKRLIEHLQYFLLELGKGFAFIGRQYRITLGNRHHCAPVVM